ncbi:MAG: 4Fe-4S dicluster domain-containing protein [Alphaproteobacteria bacterium]|nr:4Fe-4S dicluster domain-containing protein [Alphaproteobacteria bacterium]MDE2111260.1 4Fe-4S dicluster domain-containing protein [Alphaproteobacteria bacterium]MDE2492564.1 4Fe-4S dicluster domain-containing protein [Alphaproteobacteria bacterium]
MNIDRARITQMITLEISGLQALLDALAKRGYRVIGPKLRDQAIAYDDISSVRDLPAGWTDEQEGGHYRVTRRSDDALFGYAVGPHSWKRFLYPPIQQLWRARHKGSAVSVTPVPPSAERFAFFGVRACELHAIEIQDRVFMNGELADPHYKARRENAFVVAVNCGTAGGTCFCVSMNTGPGVKRGFDIALTELVEGGAHRFVVEAGSDKGREVLAALPQHAAKPEEIKAAEAVVAKTASSMGRAMKADDVREVLMRNLDNPRWDHVAERCMTCGNCTMVCPTCFCMTVEDSSDLEGLETSRSRRWDSCFTMDHSYVHGGSVRGSAKARYRQWLTHKLATWVDQFGTSGCVGCGRCITWCPVGIDITEEVAAIRNSESR